jgi:hypothetical protein
MRYCEALTVKENFSINCVGQAMKKKLAGGSEAQTHLKQGQFNKAQIRTTYSTEEIQQTEDLQVAHAIFFFFFDR